MSNCCGCNKRILSNTASECESSFCCDACTMPSCGDPKYLTVLAPVVYDEIGVNVCRNIDVSGYATEFPDMTYLEFEPLNYDFTDASAVPVINQLQNRPNCYEVTLSNIRIRFVVKIYNCCRQLIATRLTSPLSYLPPNTDPSYNQETNPSSVTFEIFAPYGISYYDTTTAAEPSPYLNIVGFSNANNFITQGLNLTVIPKVLSYDSASQSVNVGLSLIVSSVYFSPYLLNHHGKATVSKGTSPIEVISVCKKFVEGSLLDRNIKPLEFGNPFDKKQDCSDDNMNPCDNNEILDEIFE